MLTFSDTTRSVSLASGKKSSTGIDGSTAYDEACELLIAQFTSPDFQISGLTGDMTWDVSGAVTKIPTAVVIQDGTYVGFNG